MNLHPDAKIVNLVLFQLVRADEAALQTIGLTVANVAAFQLAITKMAFKESWRNRLLGTD